MSVPHDRDRVPVPPDFDEVDHGGHGADDLHAVRVMIRDTIERIVSLVHYSDVVPPGRQWTIPIGLDCGFDGELVIRVHDAGSCERAPASDVMLESAIATAIDIGTARGRRR